VHTIQSQGSKLNFNSVSNQEDINNHSKIENMREEQNNQAPDEIKHNKIDKILTKIQFKHKEELKYQKPINRILKAENNLPKEGYASYTKIIHTKNSNFYDYNDRDAFQH